METDPVLWKSLRVGDRIRIVEVPSEFFHEGYYIHRDTLRAYRRLVARGRPLRVCKVDEWSVPWVRCCFRRKNGRWEHHSLAVNHDGLVRVKPRKERPGP
jgi:hypothetical protein